MSDRITQNDLKVADRVVIASVGEHSIATASHDDAVRLPEFGAVVSFVGIVRNHDEGRVVRRLEYSAHPSAQAVLQQVAANVAALPGIGRVAVSHRVGMLEIGEAALVAAVSAAHRRAAFDGCQLLVEQVKVQLPVWKRQEFEDGTSEWVNCS
ncbi:MAG: molybdenum cofactor biosynthesis protein MoaE [Actinobacteria bacterium]|nr:molybdenum cofactor biosynthesis protein MoaE [Actinomycetota bacterium]